MPSFERQYLPGRTAPVAHTSQAGCVVAFGLPFVAAGAFIMLVAADVIHAPDSSFHAPRGLVGGIGVLFAASGVFLMYSGVAGMLRRSAVERRRRKRPDEPWDWDYAWNPSGSSRGGLGEQLGGFVGLGLFALFLAPFNWIGLTTRDPVWMAVTGLFDLLLLGGVGVGLYRLARWIQYGGSRLRYARFPFFLGDSLEAHLEGARRLKRFRSLTLSLRAVEAVAEGSKGQSSCYRIYEDRQTLVRDLAHLDADLRIVFPLPNGDLETRLRAPLPRFWELEIQADTPGIDYAETFLVPVYERPAPR